MAEETETWGYYSKLVLKELERLNENHEKMRSDWETKFGEINGKLSDVKNLEKIILDQKGWIEKVNDVWSPMAMKEAKDEIYKQKTRWAAAIAIISFIQILIGVALAMWKN